LFACIDCAPTARALRRALITMAHALSMKVAAQGVETPARSDLLLRTESAAGQGQLFA